MTKIELRAKRFSIDSNYYILQYRIKNFIPEIIPPKNSFEKFIRKIFGNKYTKNEWITLTHWTHVNYTKENIHIFGTTHPYRYWQEELIRYEDIDSYKDKFSYLEDIEEYNKEEENRYKESLKLYKEYQINLKSEIVL